MRNTARWVVILLAVWMLVILYMFGSVYQTSDDSAATHERIRRALSELDHLRAQNEELRNFINELRVKPPSDVQSAVHVEASHSDEHNQDSFRPPSKASEQLRRKAQNGVTELWFYISAELKSLADLSSVSANTKERIFKLLDNAGFQQNTVIDDLEKLANIAGLKAWREKEAQELSDIVQKRLHKLQNPDDCKSAKKLLCNVNKGCGYGCQLHHVMYCFMVSYATHRTLILQSGSWRYGSGGWEKVFLPVSNTCMTTNGGAVPWDAPEKIKNAQVISLPIVDSVRPRPEALPLSIPKDLSERLLRFHGDPSVWWVGQFVKYLNRLQPELAEDIERTREKIGFLSPIVGVHVRRTDKVGTEAALHSIDEYMYHVEEWYQRLEINHPVEMRQVYLATDEPRVIAEARKKYPRYRFLCDETIAQTAGLSQRYSDAALRGIIIDIYFLSQTDYLVCTFSSQVCRVAYEMMNAIHPDASTWFRSLDDIYYFGGQHAHNQRAVYPHQKQRPDEIDLEVGDIVGIAGNHWDGYSKGTNRRTGERGLYPSFKTEEEYVLVDIPPYNDGS